MKIVKLGLDLDNTLINYSEAARIYARQNNIEAISTLANLRNVLRTKSDLEWQKAQAWLYSYGLEFATPVEGWSDFLIELKYFNLDIYLISHKTKFTPKSTGKIEIREYAMKWLEEVLKVKEIPQIQGVYFESTRKKKIARINSLGLNCFVDDLQEVLDNPNFPIGVRKVLFGAKSSNTSIKSIKSFNTLMRVVLSD